jgi:hypothetical protein
MVKTITVREVYGKLIAIGTKASVTFVVIESQYHRNAKKAQGKVDLTKKQSFKLYFKRTEKLIILDSDVLIKSWMKILQRRPSPQNR